MWQVHGLEGRILVGWERGKTEKGVPYYIHHKSEQTQWDHPLLVSAMEDILDCNSTKYAAYRTALKIRILQKFAKLHTVTLPTIISVFDQHGFRLDQNDAFMHIDELESLLTDIFHMTKREEPSQMDMKLLAEISMNILMNFYDRARNGIIKVSHAKVALTLLCSARLQEKYKYLFRQFADHNNCISRKKLVELLNSLAQIPEFVSEKPSFGLTLVSAAVESCFRLESGHLGVNEESFLEWLLCEPQTLVWISTLYRLASAEAVLHDAKCSVCKMSPIAGLRYQCLRCFHYDLCQNCFFMGLSNKGHKLYHPLQEYCFKSTSKEGTKALMKTIRNKFSKKTSAKSKQRYLPIVSTAPNINDKNGQENNYGPSENQENILPLKVSKILQTDCIKKEGESEETSDTALHSRTIIQESLPQKDTENQHHYRELQSIILHLEEEKRQLLSVIGRLRSVGPVNSAIHSVHDQEQRAQVLAQQVLLEDHTYQLDLQLFRLKSLLQYLCSSSGEHTVTPKANVGVHLQPKESTPLLSIERPPFTFVSPSTPSYGFETHLKGVTKSHFTQPAPQYSNKWDRPFGNQGSFARKSLPMKNFKRSYSSQSPGSFHRSSARAVLQTREFSNVSNLSVPGVESTVVQRPRHNQQAKLHDQSSADAPPHIYSEISSEGCSQGFSHFQNCSNDNNSSSLYDPSFSGGYNRIHRELGSIINKLESVYPGCVPSQPKNDTKTGDTEKMIQAAVAIEDMIKEFVNKLGAPEPTGQQKNELSDK